MDCFKEVLIVVLVRLAFSCEGQAAYINARNSGHCKVNGIDYKDGDTFFKPQNPVQENNVGCRSCVCDRGNATCNHFYTCDFPLQCEKYIPAPQGLCCPTCACYQGNTKYRDGQKWIKWQGSVCFECTCDSQEAKCNRAICPVNCQNPIQEPGKCCPTCNPGAAPVTGLPAFTIKQTTARPPPMWPPGFPGDFPGDFPNWWLSKCKVFRVYLSIYLFLYMCVCCWTRFTEVHQEMFFVTNDESPIVIGHHKEEKR